MWVIHLQFLTDCYQFANVQFLFVCVDIVIETTSFGQGTIVYFELHSDKEIAPNDIVDNRTDCIDQFNEEFCADDELDNLW